MTDATNWHWGAGAAAGIVANAPETAAVLVALMRGKLLQRQWLKTMRQDVLHGGSNPLRRARARVGWCRRRLQDRCLRQRRRLARRRSAAQCPQVRRSRRHDGHANDDRPLLRRVSHDVAVRGPLVRWCEEQQSRRGQSQAARELSSSATLCATRGPSLERPLLAISEHLRSDLLRRLLRPTSDRLRSDTRRACSGRLAVARVGAELAPALERRSERVRADDDGVSGEYLAS
jgi:hypothetical protein